KIKLVNISVDDILLAARQHHGIYELKAIKFAILERNGQISIIPEQE
ncbi:TPA: YetF domain-containing protein, partial [Klebsiella pneumoniae]